MEKDYNYYDYPWKKDKIHEALLYCNSDTRMLRWDVHHENRINKKNTQQIKLEKIKRSIEIAINNYETYYICKKYKTEIWETRVIWKEKEIKDWTRIKIGYADWYIIHPHENIIKMYIEMRGIEQISNLN
jgi:hypothetical protein